MNLLRAEVKAITGMDGAVIVKSLTTSTRAQGSVHFTVMLK